MPMLTVFAQISNAATGMMRLQTSVKAVMASVTAKTTAINKDTVAVASNTTAIRSSTRISQIHQQMLVKLTSVTGSLTVSTIALTAAYTMGLSLAISGMCILFNKLSNNTQEVTDKQDILSDSTQSFSNSLSEAKSQIDLEVVSLSQLISSNSDASKKIAELNNKYGESLGYHRTAAEWYDILITKSETYCNAIVYEAQAKVLAARKATKELELESLKQRKIQMDESGTSTERGFKGGNWGNFPTKEYKSVTSDISNLESEVSQLSSSFTNCIIKMQNANEELKGTKQTISEQAMSYAELTNSISENESKLKQLSPQEIAEINRLKKINNELKKRRDEIGKQIGLTAITKPTNDGNSKLEPVNPDQLNTIQDIDQAIAYQRTLRATATAQNISGINKEIERLQSLKQDLEKWCIESPKLPRRVVKDRSSV